MLMQPVSLNISVPSYGLGVNSMVARPAMTPVPGFQGSLQGFQWNPGFFNTGLNGTYGSLGSINSGFLGVPYQPPAYGNGGVSAMSMMAMLGQMIALMTQFMSMYSGQGAFPGMMQNGNAGGGLVPSGGGFGGGNGAAGGPAYGGGSTPGGGDAVAPSGNTAAPSTSGGASPVKIGPGTKVLEIGDSHSVGAFGHELDAKLRGTGAQVATYASAGATASTFVQGKSTKYGYWEKHADGSERTVGYGKSAQTPRLDDLINKERPSVIVVNLGANFRGSNPKSQVDELGQVAKKHGIPIVWVGPPKTGKDGSNSAELAKFDQQMAAAVAPYGTYVSSNRHTPHYSGGDGLHYTGTQGTQLAKSWADGVFGDIMGA